MSYSDHSIGGGNTRKPKMAPAKPEPKDPLINTVLDQRYLIESKLGHGGFGSVYLGADKKMISRKIVIKVMNSEEVSNDWSKKKFQQELEALARINHSSVVGVLDCGETPDARPYIVMQYIDGVSLRSLITPEGMSFCRASNIIKQVGKALSAAHQAGILHRDLKPENIMVHLNDDEEQVKVIDFGVAKVRNSIIDVSTAEGISVGTIAYMSPEQLTAKAVLPESDIYSMAVIAYEMLTGRRPNNPESAFQLLEMQRMGVRVKPSALRPSLNPKAEQILLKALSFSADDRYNRAREFGDVLSDALLTDYEQTLLPTQKMKESPVNEILDESSLQTAHVLFLDIVGYSRSLIDEQKKNLMHLQEIVGASDECKRATEAERFIALPTGDGMALVFFNEVEAPVRCAVELSRALRATPEIKLRMGIHSGLVYRMADIKNNMNVAGGGINLAQRVMDCGDAGHILLSKRVADDIGQLARWSPHLHDLGNAKVKHGVLVHVYNLYAEDFGNAAVPPKLQKRNGANRNLLLRIAVATIVLGIVGTALFYWYRSRASLAPAINVPTTTETASLGPERSLTYWLSYQKMRDGKIDSEPRQSAGNDIFGNGWRFQFNVTPNEPGALYLLNVGLDKKGEEQYNVLFPLPGVGQSDPNLKANQIFKSGWADFVDQTGVERIWIIWSQHPIVELNTIFTNAVRNEGVVRSADEIKTIQSYLDAGNSSVVNDKEKKQTVVKGRGEILVSVVELTHEAN